MHIRWYNFLSPLISPDLILVFLFLVYIFIYIFLYLFFAVWFLIAIILGCDVILHSLHRSLGFLN